MCFDFVKVTRNFTYLEKQQNFLFNLLKYVIHILVQYLNNNKSSSFCQMFTMKNPGLYNCFNFYVSYKKCKKTFNLNTLNIRGAEKVT